MPGTYTATAKRNPGRRSWLVEFRHPLRKDSGNKPGKKTRKGLGTEVEEDAMRLAAQLNELLRDSSLWSIGARGQAALKYDDGVVEIFYSELEPRQAETRELLDRVKLPTTADGYVRVRLLGVPGAGKTTLIRQLIGTKPKVEGFPSTSVNRTTTFPTEVVLHDGDFEAVVTFMSEHEVRFEIEASLSSAILEAVDGASDKIARAFLEKSDMRFRLKYLLGDLQEDEEIDPYAEVDEDTSDEADQSLYVLPDERALFSRTLSGYLDRIQALATTLREQVESEQGSLDSMSSEDRSAALDLIEEQAATSDEFLELVSDVLDELRAKFDLVTIGRFERTTTGWPRAWVHTGDPEDRQSFLRSVTFFSGISYRSWGKLLTPLVNGMRVAGQFKPEWATQAPRMVLVDTEGLGHKAGVTADLPVGMATLLHEADVVLLVDSAKNGMTSFAAGKALEGVVNAGHTRKLAVVFTHMDIVSGGNLKGRSKLDHVFGGLRNVVENQVAKSVSTDAARYLLAQLEERTFYVGKIDQFDPKPAKPELERLLGLLVASQPPVF